MGVFDRDQAVRDIQQKAKDTREAGELWRKRVEGEAIKGDHQAIILEKQATQDGFRRQYIGVAKQLNGSYLLSAKRISRRIKQVFGVRERDPNGAKTKSFQLSFWMECTWDEIKELVRAQQEQRNAVTANILGMQKALLLEKKCPGAMSPADACRQLGIKPDVYLAS